MEKTETVKKLPPDNQGKSDEDAELTARLKSAKDQAKDSEIKTQQQLNALGTKLDADIEASKEETARKQLQEDEERNRQCAMAPRVKMEISLAGLSRLAGESITSADREVAVDRCLQLP